MMRSNRLDDCSSGPGELLAAESVYSGMRVLCVGRHQFLSEHLCRYFGGLGAHCESVVGVAEVSTAAGRFDPHVVVADCDLLTPSVLDAWSETETLRDVPVLAISLTRRPEEGPSQALIGHTGVVYLPQLDDRQAAALLKAARRPKGVVAPHGVLQSPTHSLPIAL